MLVAEDKQATSRDITRLPVSTNRSSPEAGLIELRAFGVCPFAHKHDLKKTLLVLCTFIYLTTHGYFMY